MNTDIQIAIGLFKNNIYNFVNNVYFGTGPCHGFDNLVFVGHELTNQRVFIGPDAIEELQGLYDLLSEETVHIEGLSQAYLHYKRVH